MEDYTADKGLLGKNSPIDTEWASKGHWTALREVRPARAIPAKRCIRVGKKAIR
jgi:hypothetical protein